MTIPVKKPPQTAARKLIEQMAASMHPVPSRRAKVKDHRKGRRRTDRCRRAIDRLTAIRQNAQRRDRLR